MSRSRLRWTGRSGRCMYRTCLPVRTVPSKGEPLELDRHLPIWGPIQQCNKADFRSSPMVATGSVDLLLSCDVEGPTPSRCTTRTPRFDINTKQQESHFSSDVSCAANAAKFPSWAIDEYSRQYPLTAPGAVVSASTDVSKFRLRNTASGETFGCTSTASLGLRKRAAVVGTCTQSVTATSSSTTLSFRFDTNLKMLTVTQSWTCDTTFAPQDCSQ
jgi:hypothetical protein